MSNKVKRFAIIMDEQDKSRNKSFFTRLIDSLSEKLRRGQRPTMESKLRDLLDQCDFSYGRRICIDEDFDFVPTGKWRLSANTNKYFLMRDFDKLLDILTDYCDEPCKCKRHKKSNDYEVEITIETPKRKKLRKVTTYDKVTILERWVKIGYDMYRKQFDYKTGKEYIVVDGDVYIIKYDRYGNEYLA
jgi:hypothetical protein